MSNRSNRSNRSKSTRRRVGWGAIGVTIVLAIAMFRPVSAQVTPGQTVQSTSGIFASVRASSFVPSEHNQLPDGRILEFEASFSLPQGIVQGTPPADGVDLAEPVAALRMTALTPYVAGDYRSETTLCDTVANVSSYNAGSLTSGSAGSHRVWSGAWFDVECDAGLGFDAFRVHLTPAPGWPAWVFDGDVRAENWPVHLWGGGGRVGSVVSAAIVQKQVTTAMLCGRGGQLGHRCFYGPAAGSTATNGTIWLEEGMTNTLEAL